MPVSRLLVTVLSAAALACASLAASPATIAAGAPAAVPAVDCSRDDPDPSALWVVVAEPEFANDGAVDVTTSTEHVRIDANALGFNDRPGGFGRAATSGLVNDDNCTDLVVTARSGAGEGSVYVILGDDRGPDLDAAYRLDAPAGAGDSWGSSVALLGTPRVIAVGAPGSVLAPQSGGAVVLYPLASDGTADSPTILTQDSAGVPGASESGDLFGAALAAMPPAEFGGPWGLVVGAPGEAVGSRKQAGAVTLLRLTGTGLGFAARSFTQDSAGFATAAEAGDLFGASVSSVSRYVAAGAPGEGIGRAGHAGLVAVLTLDKATFTDVVSVRSVTQDSAGVPGKSESGDRWGYAVAFNGNNTVGCGGMELGVGAPFEDIGKAADAGTVTVISSKAGCPAKLLEQGTKLVGGTPEKGDRFGWAVSSRPDPDGLEEDVDNGWVIGAPGEDLAAGVDAGYVYVLQLGWSTSDGDQHRTIVQPVGGPMAGEEFGTVLGAP